jgi:hypothetical protein
VNSSTTVGSSSLPEPSKSALLLVGTLAGLVVLRRD